jgi:hypothetical protein
MMAFRERRKAPRVDAEFPVILEGGISEASGRTLNISSSGIYCEIPRYIEPLTRIRMELLIPTRAESDDEGVRVGFDGVVVRTEPELPSTETVTYKIAVFFTSIPESSTKILNSFIEKHLPR